VGWVLIGDIVEKPVAGLGDHARTGKRR
jgi:hypothetical protein